jgi:hypothetical protein
MKFNWKPLVLSSVSDPQSIGHLDPDPGGLKRAKIKKNNAAKRQIIRHKKV